MVVYLNEEVAQVIGGFLFSVDVEGYKSPKMLL